MQSDSWSCAPALVPVSVEYVPTGHMVQAVDTIAPIAMEYLPAEQIVHIVASISDQLPGLHCRLAVALQKLPGKHAVQLEALDPE